MYEELRRLNYVDGKNLKLEIYGKEDNAAGLDALAAEVVASKPDVIFVDSVGSTIFKRLTTTIPVVVIASDLVFQGLVQSLSHPGGNITGVATDMGPAIWGKRIALLREMVPALAKLALISLTYTSFRSVQESAIREAAEAAGVTLVVVPIKYPSAEADYRAGIEAASQAGADAVLFWQDPQTIAFAAALAQFAAAARLPAIYPFRENVEAGGLMAYSEDLLEILRRAGAQIAAILDGANPGDIPVERPSRFLLTINLKAARALGLDPPQALLAAAEDVIE
jgi:putative ABC transport system substrate-binding protein